MRKCHFSRTDPFTDPFTEYEWTPTLPTHGKLTIDAHTQMTLYTGGKSGVKKKNLFCLSASAGRYGQPQEGPWMKTPITSIDATSLKIGGLGSPGADGKLWKALPDNDTPDVTVTAPAKHYGASVGAGKYILTISANNVDLSTTVPEFCVGQNVTFSPGWSGGVLPATEIVSKWTLPQKYVNEKWQNQMYVPGPNGTDGYYQGYGSVNYDVNFNLLTNYTTSCWFVNGTGGGVKLGLNLQFENGQQVVLTAKGSFSVFRPNTVMVNPDQHGSPTVVWESSWGIIPALRSGAIQLGKQGGPNNMSYLARVISSDFGGEAKITQICTIDASGLNGSCSGCLDGSDPYSGAVDVMVSKSSNPTGNANLLNLDDAPDANTTTGSVYMDDSFVDYIMFNPDPNGSGIFVTIGKVTWQVSASATYPDNNISQSISGPSGPADNDDFPTWTSVK